MLDPCPKRATRISAFRTGLKMQRALYMLAELHHNKED